MSLYSRKISFPNIPSLEPYQADNYFENSTAGADGIAVYRAKNTDVDRNVVEHKYYWVNSKREHVPFFNDEIQLSNGIPSAAPTNGQPIVAIDTNTGVIYGWDGLTWVNQSTATDTSIYLNDGILTGNRELDGNSFNLTYSNLGIFEIECTSLVLTNDLTVNNSSTDLLVRNNITGELQKRTVASLPGSSDTNLANTDLTLTASRYHSLGNYNLTFNAAAGLGNNFVINIDNIDLNSAIRTKVRNILNIQTPPVANLTSTTVLVRNSVTGNVEELPISILPTGQSPLQFQDEGINLGTLGTVNTLNFTGAGVLATRVGNQVNVDIAGGGGGGASYTDEQAQDAVASMLTNGGGITWTYNDALATISATVSITTFDITNFTEGVQDVLGTILQDSDTINYTYNDLANTITTDVITQLSVTSDASGVKLLNDIAFPAALSHYGTNLSGTKGWSKDFIQYDSSESAWTSYLVTHTNKNIVGGFAENLLFGKNAGAGLTTGHRVTIFGSGSNGFLLDDAEYTTIVGYGNMLSNSNGYGSIIYGSLNEGTVGGFFNTVLGYGNLKSIVAINNGNASSNTIVGYGNLIEASSNNNVTIGKENFINATIGSENISIGNNNGISLTTGSKNILIGNNVNGTAGASKQLIIGDSFTGLGAGTWLDPNYVVNASGTKTFYYDDATGKITYDVLPPTFYTANGTLSSNRVVNASSFNINFNTSNNFNIESQRSRIGDYNTLGNGTFIDINDSVKKFEVNSDGKKSLILDTQNYVFCIGEYGINGPIINSTITTNYVNGAALTELTQDNFALCKGLVYKSFLLASDGSNMVENYHLVIFCDLILGTATVTLPLTPVYGQIHIIKHNSGVRIPGSKEVFIDGNGNTIEGNTTLVLQALYDKVTLIYNGSEWTTI